MYLKFFERSYQYLFRHYEDNNLIHKHCIFLLHLLIVLLFFYYNNIFLFFSESESFSFLPFPESLNKFIILLKEGKQQDHHSHSNSEGFNPNFTAIKLDAVIGRKTENISCFSFNHLF